MTEVYLIRHGESEANAAEYLDISSDTYIFECLLTISLEIRKIRYRYCLFVNS